MRIAIVSPFDPHARSAPSARAHVGGVERVLREFAQRLAKRGHELTVVCSSPGHDGEFVEGGLRVIRRRRTRTVLRAPVAPLAEAIPSDVDIVHVPATYPFTTPAVLRRCQTLGVPSVLDFHFEPAPGTPLGRAAARAYRMLGPRTYPLADAVLVRSLAYAAKSPSLQNVPRERLRVLPNGVDVTRFKPPTLPSAADHLLFAGRLVPYKGVEFLLEALATRPVDLPLTIVGDGPLRRRLEALARHWRVRARFRGAVPDEELVRLYQSAALTILPSVTRQEAFGMTLLESMACGTPVVASALPGVADVALHGGLAVPPGDPERLANAIARAAQPGVLPRGPALARRIHAAFGWDTLTQKLEGFYDEVLGRRRPSTAPDTEVTLHAHPGRQPLL